MPLGVLRALTIAALTIACAACADPAPVIGPVDASVVADAAVPPDAGPPPRVECACDETEDCRACLEHVGECCYQDATWFGQLDALVENCEANAACRTCCSECLAKTCDELVASADCPNQ
ncbi:hypothetical protein L6R52_32000 [Myxococcota bacterium]|nr:hypothetical protein [Myxococcota bacterium]